MQCLQKPTAPDKVTLFHLKEFHSASPYITVCEIPRNSKESFIVLEFCCTE